MHAFIDWDGLPPGQIPVVAGTDNSIVVVTDSEIVVTPPNRVSID
jgi:hypothetical protein